MPILDNPRHERFCQLMFEGRSQAEAYQLTTGCTIESANSNAYRLMEDDGIKGRIRELQAATVKKRMLTRERSLEILHDIVETPIGEINEDHPLAQAVKRSPEGNVVGVKMPAKLDALTLNAKLQGWLTERTEHTLKLSIYHAGDEKPVIDV